MSDLIDRQELLKHKGNCYDEEGHLLYAVGTGTILLMPTVDAEPVRHGKWVHTKWSNMRHDYSCSLCGCRISGVDPFSLSATAYYYCPECGAKMDEVEDG